jgi:drug/metabolite transporter (DMT)-like permease
MIDAWMPITIAAALFQVVRTGGQKQLKGRMTTTSVTFVRFAYGVPFALVFYAIAHHFSAEPAPVPGRTFVIGVFGAAVSQIIATYLLVLLFSFRNFAVGTTYSKTESVQTAILGALFFAAPVGPIAFVGILISLAGVMAMSAVRDGAGLRGVLIGWTEKTALVGIASGGCFALATLFIRMASLSLESGSFALRAATVLVCMSSLQTALMAVYILLRARDQLRPIIGAWKPALFVGFTSVGGSACWAMAFTLQSVAYVRALGQVELVFTFLASWLFFGEKSRTSEIVGIIMMIAGILVMLLGK